MKLVICLGNPTEKYSRTRHNTGFMFADKLAEKINSTFSKETKLKSEIAKGVYKNEAIWIVKPQTYMNLSGEALFAIRNFYKSGTENFILVYDDISLDLGTIRLKSKGSDGGHNGVKSIIKYAQTDVFDRIKIGIGPQPPFIKSEDYVLQNFDTASDKLLEETLNKAVEAFLYYCDTDIYKAQNKYN